MLISLNHIRKNYGSNQVLDDISFQLNPGDKVGLVGRNGSGKTTLLRIIYGDLEAEEGELVRHPHVRIGVMQQLVHVDSERSMLDEALSVFTHMEELAEAIEELEAEIEAHSQSEGLQSLLDQYGQLQTRWELEGGYSYKAKTKATLFGLGFEECDLTKSTHEMSGGELNRLNLAKLLLSQPNLLLLDEPTNHLDIASIRWLEEFLRDYPNAFLVISHDRYFLDHTVNKILDLSGGKVEEYPGNYSWYVEERERRLLAREKEYDAQQELIARTEDFIRRNMAGQKTKQAQSRQKMLNRMERLERVRKDGSAARFRFEMQAQSGDLVLETEDLRVGYDGATVAGPLSFRMFRSNHLGIIGPNGSGKSTLLRTLLGFLPPVQGEVHLGQKVSIAFYDQQLSSLNLDLTVLEEMRQIWPLATDETLRGYLARFLFRGDEVYKRVASLSGGEKSRLALAKLIFGKANTLVLDEPTNHLDIPSREVLEEALSEFPGTLLVVSHDRYLINKLAERILYLDGQGNALLFDGSYEEFETKNPPTNVLQPAAKVETAKAKPHPAAESGAPQLSKNELNKIKNRCAALEAEIEQVEASIDSTTQALNAPDNSSDYLRLKELGEQYETLIATRQRLYHEWDQTLALLESNQP